ncbi:MAG: molybdopterin cofactor-binding domain-containing protein [Myxococcota bacterium]
MNRRDMISQLCGMGGVLLVGATTSGCGSYRPKDVVRLLEQTGAFRPNSFVSLHTDGLIVLAMNKSEMGQGVMTASVTLLAEELAVHPSNIKAIPVYNLALGNQMTGGSNSTKELFLPIRRAGAAAREMLKNAAADYWNVSSESCVAKDGFIYHGDQRIAYVDLIETAARLTAPNDPPLKSASEFQWIGQKRQRADGLDKSTGIAQFGMDIAIEGKVCAYVIRPPQLGATALSVSSDDALSQIGVIKIFAYSRGVAVVAHKYWQAARAAKKVEVEWGEGATKGLHTADLAKAARLQTAQKAAHRPKDIGKIEPIFDEHKSRMIEAQYGFPYLSHATMEPQNCTALVSKSKIKLWVPTQAPTMCARVAAAIHGIPIENVDVEITMLGGGFGRRSAIDFVSDAVLIARHLPDTPVQVIWSREDDMSLGYYRPIGDCRMRGVFSEKGEVLGIHSHLVSQQHFPDMRDSIVGMFPTAFPPKLRQKLGDATISFIQTTGLMGFFEGGEIVGTKYNFPHFRFEYTPITTQVPVTAWRSVAHSYSTFMMETFIDMLCHAANTDPVEVRRKFLSEHPLHCSVMDKAIAESNWGAPIEDGWGRGFALSEFFGSVVAQVVEAGIVDGQIRVRHVTCAVDCGLVVNPDIVRAQIESGIVYGLSMMHEKVELIDGVVQQHNFDTFPVFRMHQMPEISVFVLPSDRHPSGIGEIGLPPINAAVSNALFAATGHRLTDMPMQDAWDKVAASVEKT